MSKPIGRIWKNLDSISGYIVIGPNLCIKFAASMNNKVNWIFESKKEQIESKEEMISFESNQEAEKERLANLDYC